jgi:hypothetical protein
LQQQRVQVHRRAEMEIDLRVIAGQRQQFGRHVVLGVARAQQHAGHTATSVAPSATQAAAASAMVGAANSR